MKKIVILTLCMALVAMSLSSCLITARQLQPPISLPDKPEPVTDPVNTPVTDPIDPPATDPIDPVVQTGKTGELSADYLRTSTKQPEVDKRFRQVAADFAFEMLEELPMERGENVLFSPLSALACLGMVTGGAEGKTLRQIEDALEIEEDVLTESLYAYISSLYSGKNCKFGIANSIWANASDGNFRVNEDFLQKNADWYGAQIYRVPFDQKAVDDMNAWVNDRTDGMIEKIRDEIDPMTVMVLINALVFDAAWQEPYYDFSVLEEDFTAYGGKTQPARYLCSQEDTYLQIEGAVGFAKPYAGGAYSFVALLPDADEDIYEFARDLDGDDFLQMRDNALLRSHVIKVSARIPEFTYDDSFSLMGAFKEMGITDLFSPTDADLSGLGSYHGGNIFCSAFEQKTFIEVSQYGTKAAAVTSADMTAESAAPNYEIVEIHLNRPFVYAIVDNATGLPLFIGIVATVE